MRTTATLDDDVAALIKQERDRTGESFRDVLNRLVRRGALAGPLPEAPPLPVIHGRLLVDISDVSALLAALDDERRAERGLP